MKDKIGIAFDQAVIRSFSFLSQGHEFEPPRFVHTKDSCYALFVRGNSGIEIVFDRREWSLDVLIVFHSDGFDRRGTTVYKGRRIRAYLLSELSTRGLTVDRGAQTALISLNRSAQSRVGNWELIDSSIRHMGQILKPYVEELLGSDTDHSVQANKVGHPRST